MREPSAILKSLMSTERAAASKVPGPGVIQMHTGDPDFPTPAFIAEALNDAVERGYRRTRRNVGPLGYHLQLRQRENVVAGTRPEAVRRDAQVSSVNAIAGCADRMTPRIGDV